MMCYVAARGNIRIFAAVICAGLCVVSSARADDGTVVTGIPNPSIATSLLDNGDPGGVRAALAVAGITYGINYTGDYYDVARGGFSRGSTFNGLLEVYGAADLEKVLGWRGANFHFNGYNIEGRGPSTAHIGNIFTVSNAEALATVRLFELWIEQSLFDNKLQIRAGQLGADSDFFISDNATLFINGTFGWPGIAGSDMIQGGPAYPLATPGVRLQFAPSDHLTVLAGVYNGSPANPKAVNPEADDRYGLNFRLSDPPLLMFEARYRYDAGLPGTVRLGGWQQSGDFKDQRTGARVDDDHAVYAVVDQQIWKGSGGGQGISVFGRISASPERQNLINFYFDAGVVTTGLIEGRDQDRFGVAFAYGQISDRAAAADRDAALPVVRDYEAALEVIYEAQIMPGWKLVPDVQYIWHPGGNIENPGKPGVAIGDAAVFGIRSTVNY